MKRLCLECQSIIRGRTDKKFCCGDCKSLYHNRRNRSANAFMRQTNTVLRKNRRILKNFMDSKATVVHKEELLSNGFSFKHFTSQNIKAEFIESHVYDFTYTTKDHIHFEISVAKERNGDTENESNPEHRIFSRNLRKISRNVHY